MTPETLSRLEAICEPVSPRWTPIKPFNGWSQYEVADYLKSLGLPVHYIAETPYTTHFAHASIYNGYLEWWTRFRK